MKIERRDFLKSMAATMALAIAAPVKILLPPREPYVSIRSGLDNLYSHLGVLPSSPELNTCEGRLLEIDAWDGTGFPCLVENACTFGPEPPRVWVYDFDLWNFRDDDYLRDQLGHNVFYSHCRYYNSHAGFYASRRFGEDTPEVVRHGGGWLKRAFFFLRLRIDQPNKTGD